MTEPLPQSAAKTEWDSKKEETNIRGWVRELCHVFTNLDIVMIRMLFLTICVENEACETHFGKQMSSRAVDFEG